jgi:hypothetical protein
VLKERGKSSSTTPDFLYLVFFANNYVFLGSQQNSSQESVEKERRRHCRIGKGKLVIRGGLYVVKKLPTAPKATRILPGVEEVKHLKGAVRIGASGWGKFERFLREK